MAILSHLTAEEASALEGLSHGLRERFSSAIHGIYLYGSKARGDFRPESDIDVLVIADQDLRDDVGWAASLIASEVITEGGPYLSVFVSTPQHWALDTPFLLNVRKDAVAL